MTAPPIVLALFVLAPAAAAQPGPALPYDAAALSAEKPASELLAEAEALVLAGRYAEAKPLVARLASFPEYALQFNFLQGYIALETGDPATAEQRFRAATALSPEYTRAKIELGRALLAQGKRSQADEQYRLAEQDKKLTPDLAELVREGRAKSAERAIWYLNVDASVIADSNINNATDLDAVPVNFGDVTLPVELDPRLQSQAGLGFGKVGDRRGQGPGLAGRDALRRRRSIDRRLSGEDRRRHLAAPCRRARADLRGRRRGVSGDTVPARIWRVSRQRGVRRSRALSAPPRRR
jgi:tetratricopeptide (TPR) repeat protein